MAKTPATQTPLGNRLRKLREAAHLSLADAAARVGVSQPTLYRWETGEQVPRLSQLAGLADAYRVPPGLILKSLSADDLRQSAPRS